MKFHKMPGLPALAMAIVLASGAARADWVQSSDPVVVTPAPKDLSLQAQNPPSFTWARHPAGPAAYTLDIRQGGKSYQTFTSTRNFYLPSKRLPNGTYTWRVRPSTSTSDADWSSERTFVIDSTAVIFEVAENADLRASITALARPRGLPRGLPLFASWGAPIKAERLNAFNKLSAEVLWFVTKLPPALDANWPLTTAGLLTAAATAQDTDVRNSIYAVGRQLEASAMMYRITNDPQFLKEALLRGDQLAALNPDGPTSYANQDQGCRVIALSLIKAVDSLNGSLDAPRKAAWLKSVEVRTNAIYADLSGSNGRMDQYPFDSHGGSNLGFLALIATLSLGDVPSAPTWFDFAFRSYISSTSPWSGPEGGFANGTAYAQYTADFALQIWQPLFHATGFDMFSKPWSAGFARYFMHFVPPGATRHLFGDQAEVVPTFNIMKGIAAQYPTQAAAWYYQNIPGEMDSLMLLQARYPLPVSAALSRTAPPNGALYPSIGWAAMHSNLADLGRTSVYFKSSPYGSYNHSHAEQNSFVVHMAGQPMLVSAGYSDFYGSTLWSTWYRQTKAHNAITFDGGVGQATDGYNKAGYSKMMGANGQITAFSTSATQDYVVGDATLSYDGKLTSAVRKMWYLRSIDAVVVQDLLVAPGTDTHKYEWNFHALAPISADATGRATVTYGGKSVCVQPITTGLTFQKPTGLPLPKTGVEDHARYVTPAVGTTEILMLIDPGCKAPAVSITSTAAGRNLKVGTEVISLPK